MPTDYPESIAAALGALDDFMAALNARDEAGINAAYNFPHIRITGTNEVVTFQESGDYKFEYFDQRTKADGWHRSEWDRREVIYAGPDKVHLDVVFSRYREDGSLIATYRSLYIVTKVEGRWGIQARSSFAP